MTARQLRRLAELAADASDFYRAADPAKARRFADAATTARHLADDMALEEATARHARSCRTR